MCYVAKIKSHFNLFSVVLNMFVTFMHSKVQKNKIRVQYEPTIDTSTCVVDKTVFRQHFSVVIQ